MSPQLSLRRIAISLAMFAIMTLGFASVARADSIVFDLNTPNAGLSGFPGPYATVTINRTSTTTATMFLITLSSFGGRRGSEACRKEKVSQTLVPVKFIPGAVHRRCQA